MGHSTPLTATIVVGLSLAFIFGVVAQRLGMSPLVGYLLAGVMVGPFTPGWVADQPLANELAEIGVIADVRRRGQPHRAGARRRG